MIKDWKALLSTENGSKPSPPSQDNQNSRSANSRDENSNSSAPSTPAPVINNGNGTTNSHPLASTSTKVQQFPRQPSAVADEVIICGD